ncbi:hypothetical protein DM01DRAFT_1338327 [Hesseltinella vesiculosa]|uniref:Uncharacterized protein n=1 Tax=Hesseltinella vesiculosa TaxID=101127 RepID=A0A1X2GAD8_9FUNG|nr:hypothetical protein DM01DRAFT_1338327 [Hesseltinella vesiculosa]
MTEVMRIRQPTEKYSTPSPKDLKAWACPSLSPLCLEGDGLSPRKRPFDLTFAN